MDVKLIVSSGKNEGKEIRLSGQQFLIGRGEGCQLRPASDRISRKHCVFIAAEGRLSLRDLGSTNGTSVNGEKIAGDKDLKNGDKINVGGVLDFEVQMTVELGGKKEAKVHSIQEAAARTVKKAAGDDLDITQWLDESDDSKKAPPIDLHLKNTSTVDQNLADTTTIQVPKEQEAKDKSIEKDKKDKEKEKEKGKPHAKIASQFERSKKPATENSGDAAGDMLRQFFGRKR
jgi:pSer/pThr/pTyr-binding forkhead associated (FHA) protein